MSSTQPQTLHIPAGLPIDESTRREHATAGQSNRMSRNARSPEKGSLEKRLGTARLSKTRLIGPTALVGTSRTTGVAVFAHQGTPTVIDNDGILESWSDALGGWVVRGLASMADYSTLDVPAPPLVAGAPVDSEVCGDYLCTVYVEVTTSGTAAAGFAYASILHLPTGVLVRYPEALTTSIFGFNVQVAQFDNRYFVACVRDSPPGNISARILDTQNLAAGWTVLVASVATASTTTVGVSMSMCSMGDRVGLVFIGTAGARVQLRTLNLTGLVSTATAGIAVNPTAVDIAYSTGLLWVTRTGDVSLTTATRVFAPNLVAIGADLPVVGSGTTEPSDVFIAAGPGVARSWTYYPNVGGKADAQGYVGTASTSALSGVVARHRGVISTTRPFYRNGLFYGYFSGGICADWSNTTDNMGLLPVANVAPGLVASGRTTPRAMPKVLAWGTTWVTTLALTVGTLKVGFNGGAFASRAVILDFAATTRILPVEHNGVNVLGGGLVQQYDGDRVHELGFLTTPLITSVQLEAGALTGTNFRHVIVYEDVGADGKIAVSGVSAPSSPTSPAAQRMIVRVTQPELTRRLRLRPGLVPGGALRITLYRTLSGGVPPYYRVSSMQVALDNADPSIRDEMSDATLATAPLLYAPNLPGVAGESLDRRAPPGLQNLVSYNGMLVGTRGSSVFNSGQPVYGEATWFSPLFETPIPSGEDDITALISLDGTLFPTKRTEIFAMSGEAPSDNGASGGMGSPRKLSSDCGCIEPRSVVSTSLGAFFQSERGIELLNRSQTVDFIGQSIQATQATYPTVVSATLDSKYSLVRIGMANATTGVAAVFDLTQKYWVSVDSMDRIPVAAAIATSGGGAVPTTVSSKRYMTIATNGDVTYERVDGEDLSHLDSGVWVTLEYTTQPVHFGLQQEQRVYEFMLLYKMNTTAGVSVLFAHDYGAVGNVDAVGKTWTSAETATAIQLPFRPQRPRGEALDLVVRDTSPGGVLSGSCKGPTFVGISSDIAIKIGNNRGTPRVNSSLRK